METNLPYELKESFITTEIPITRIFKVFDRSDNTGTLKQRLDDIDSKINKKRWHEIGRSTRKTFAAKGYESNQRTPLPLDWFEVRKLRNEAVRAAESRFGGTVEAEGGNQENDDGLTL